MNRFSYLGIKAEFKKKNCNRQLNGTIKSKNQANKKPHNKPQQSINTRTVSRIVLLMHYDMLQMEWATMIQTISCKAAMEGEQEKQVRYAVSQWVDFQIALITRETRSIYTTDVIHLTTPKSLNFKIEKLYFPISASPLHCTGFTLQTTF